MGNSGGEFGVRGWLSALHAATGRIAWRAYGTGPPTTRRFLAVAGTAVAGLSTLLIATMWLGAWVLSPCSP